MNISDEEMSSLLKGFTDNNLLKDVKNLETFRDHMSKKIQLILYLFPMILTAQYFIIVKIEDFVSSFISSS
jgi:hypothetical protein